MVAAVVAVTASSTLMSNFTLPDPLSTEFTVTVRPMVVPPAANVQRMVVPTVAVRSPGHVIESGFDPDDFVNWSETCFSTSALATAPGLVLHETLTTAAEHANRARRRRRGTRTVGLGFREDRIDEGADPDVGGNAPHGDATSLSADG